MKTRVPLALSVVDGHTKISHLVERETVRLHRRSGRYPALCGDSVITASLTTEPVSDCKKCQRTLGEAEQ